MAVEATASPNAFEAIKRHTLWLLAAFLLALTYFSGSNIWQSLTELRNAAHVSNITRSSVIISAAVHQLQRERGMSSGFIASGGKRFGEALKTQHGQTGLALNQVDSVFSGQHGTGLKSAVSIEETLRMVGKLREQVAALSISRDEAVARYTAIIAQLFGVIQSEALTSGALSRHQASFIAFLHAKEMAGQERAMLTAMLSAAEFGSHQRIGSFYSIQAVRDVHLEQFSVAVDADIRQRYAAMTAQPFFADAEKVRAQVIALTNEEPWPIQSLPTAEHWFELSTQVIDAMKAMEDGLSDAVLRHAATLERDARRQLIINGVSALASFMFAGILIWRVRRGKQQAETSLRLAGKAFSASVEAIVVTDVNAIIVEVNPAFFRITGYAPEEALGQHVRMLKSGRHDIDFYTSMWQRIAADGSWEGEIWNRRKNGDIYPAFMSIVSVNDDHGQLVNYISMTVDLSQHKKTESLLEQLRTFDPLTGLLSREAWLSAIDQALANVRDTPRQLAVLEIGLDRFKLINDSLSHAVGDLVLTETAERLRSVLRRHDAAARTGGDRFAILLEDIEDAQNVGSICEKLLAALLPPFEVGGNVLHVSASIGIAMYPADGDTTGPLLRNAESAMYRAKQEGLGTYHFYSTEMNAEGARLLALESLLRKALENNEFSLHYQPQIDTGSGHLIGVEALLRWNNAELGMVSPIQFIPMAEETGLIVPIGDWVMRTACIQAKQWLDTFGCGIPVAVNLAARQFNKPDLLSYIQVILDETGLPNHLLEIEITEGSLITDPAGAVDVLRGIREMGVRTAIDDFGTGYSSLAYLKTFPLDRLKIDRAFVRDLPDNQSDVAIARAIVALGHNLNMEVLAEGVETQAQSDFLAQTGCNIIQGYLYGKPMPGPQLSQRIAAGDYVLPGATSETATNTTNSITTEELLK